VNSTFNLKHESRKMKQSCSGRWAGVKPRCFARVSAGGGVGTLGASQSQPSSRRLRRRCNEGCVIRPQRAQYGSCRCRDDRQWQADTGRPEVKERHGGAEETDRLMKDFLWGGEERGLNKASARPIPPQQFYFFVTGHNETPQTIFL